jgi:ribosomal protein L22
MVQTEKPMGKSEKKRQGIVRTPKKQKMELSKDNKSKEEKKETELKVSEEKPEQEIKEEKTDNKKELKKPVKTKPKIKKHEAVVNGFGLPISTKKSAAICKFIRRKKIDKAIAELEEVFAKKRALPMKGEYPHKKGTMSGGYPKNATEDFIKLLKNLQANANVNELEKPVITKAIANLASRPYARFGRWRKKRTNVRIVATEKNMINKIKDK